MTLAKIIQVAMELSPAPFDALAILPGSMYGALRVYVRIGSSDYNGWLLLFNVGGARFRRGEPRS